VTTVRVAGAALLCLTISWPASADQETTANSCAEVLTALMGLGAAPSFHWSMSASSPKRRFPLKREQIVLGDNVFLTPDEGRWMRSHVTLAEREAKMRNELAQTPPGDCRLDGREIRDGMPMHIISYSQNSRDKRIWIGDADGLPHYFISSEPPVSVTMRVQYTDVQSPLP